MLLSPDKSCDSLMEEREGFVTLIDEEGNEREYEHLDTIDYEGNTFVVLLPAVEEEDDDEEEADEVYIMRIRSDDNGEDVLEPLEDEAELDAVFDIFRENAGEEFEFLD